MSVMVGVVCPGTIRWECAWSLDQARRANVIEEVRFQQSGPYVDDARNSLVRAFLDSPCDRLLMVDDDVQFMPGDVQRLADDDLPIVSGVYYNTFDGVLQPVLKLLEDTPTDDDTPLLEVAGAGAGFLMMSRTLLEKVGATYGEPCPWFAEPIIDGDHLGEDIELCRRAREAGAPVYADLRVQVAHYKTVRLTGPMLA